MDLNLITIEGHIWYKLKVWELHLISSNLKRLNSHQNDRIDIMKYIQWQNEWDDFTRIRMGLQEDKAIIFEQWCAKIKSRKWSQ